jgi:hypothetical protein
MNTSDLQAQIDKALESRTLIDPQNIVEYNGQLYKIEDLPEAGLRASFGYGHFTPFLRPCIDRPDGKPWPYTPNMCLVASGALGQTPLGVWIDDQHLCCPGCGLDCT